MNAVLLSKTTKLSNNANAVNNSNIIIYIIITDKNIYLI
jgi:hypothetical protein